MYICTPEKDIGSHGSSDIDSSAKWVLGIELLTAEPSLQPCLVCKISVMLKTVSFDFLFVRLFISLCLENLIEFQTF